MIINELQAKHMPVDPDELERLVKKLVSDMCLEGKTVVVGFAETATAIAAFVAEHLRADWFIHTTRENIDAELNVVTFKEEHSHAPEQMLFCVNPDLFSNCDNIVFVDDELTTGKTLLNFIHSLKKSEKINDSQNIFALSLINSMSSRDLKFFYDLNINVRYLNKFIMPAIVDVEGKMNPRVSVHTHSYTQAVKDFAEEIINSISFNKMETILVLGTEEFMYPAIKLAQLLKSLGFCVKTQSTTRSPIEIDDSLGYPVKTRDVFKSFYDSSRDNFLYNLDKYDKVIIVTDSENRDSMDILELATVLGKYGNEDILVVRWIN